MIDRALTAGLAGLWAWVVLNDEEGLFKKQHAFLEKWNTPRKWRDCPWCSGAWFAGLASILLGRQRLGAMLVTAGAAAGVTGLIGSHLEEG